MNAMSISQPELLHNETENITQEAELSIKDVVPYKWADKAILQQHMDRLLATLPVECEPISIELLQQEMRKAGLSPNELSQGIIQMREE